MLEGFESLKWLFQWKQSNSTIIKTCKKESAFTFTWRSLWNLWKEKREEVWKKAKRANEKRAETKEDEGKKARKQRESQN